MLHACAADVTPADVVYPIIDIIDTCDGAAAGPGEPVMTAGQYAILRAQQQGKQQAGFDAYHPAMLQGEAR